MSYITPAATKVVNEILSDINDRKGLSDEWDSIDYEVQREIIDSWAEIVQRHLNHFRTEFISGLL